MQISDRVTELLAGIEERKETMFRINADLQRELRERKTQQRRERNASARFKEKNPARWLALQMRARKKRRANLAAMREGVPPDVLAAADALRDAWLVDPAWVCSYCGKSAPRCQRTADHITPTSRGGKHTPDNLRPACRSRKNARTLWFA